MKHSHLALCLLLLLSDAVAQSPNPKQPPTRTPATAPTPAPNPNGQINDRRAQACSLLASLATDARTFQDQTLRARSLARIADALWQVDSDQARAILHPKKDTASQ
jgi:hypothetical protein